MTVNIVLMVLLWLMVLISVAFFTLLERKILGYVQARKGPDKSLFKGILQPMMDGMKLFMKENISNLNSSKFFFFFFSFFSLINMLMLWWVFYFDMLDMFKFSMVFFIMISGLSVYSIMGGGWASNSKYSIMGAYRSVAQVISYEVGMVFLLLVFFIFLNNVNINQMLALNSFSHLYFFGMSIMFVVWLVIIMAELNRAPFDFAESESELVSGFNIEYGGVKFAFLFLSEYGSMIFLSYISMCLYFYSLYMYMLLMMFIMVWVRGTEPRYRYDNLMMLNWKIYLPFILTMFIMIYMVNINFFNL